MTQHPTKDRNKDVNKNNQAQRQQNNEENHETRFPEPHRNEDPSLKDISDEQKENQKPKRHNEYTRKLEEQILLLQRKLYYTRLNLTLARQKLHKQYEHRNVHTRSKCKNEQKQKKKKKYRVGRNESFSESYECAQRTSGIPIRSSADDIHEKYRLPILHHSAGDVPKFTNFGPFPKEKRPTAATSDDIQCSSERGESELENGNGNTYLITAITLGDLIEVKRLVLEDKQDVDTVDKIFKRPPILWALISSVGPDIDIVDFLIDNKCRLNVIDQNLVTTPLHLCISKKKFRPLLDKVLSNLRYFDIFNKDGHTPLMLAVQNNQIDIIRKLLKSGADPNLNEKSGPGYYPLHIACKNQNIEAVQMLLASSAQVNNLDTDGNTALHIAVDCRSLEITEFLLRHKADSSVVNKQGSTPLLTISPSPQMINLLESYNPRSRYWKGEINHIHVIYSKTPQHAGNHGIVYKGTIHGTPCAIKVLPKADKINKKDQEALENEIGLMSDICHHPNLALYLGTCIHPELGQCVITEYIEGGSLFDYIQKMRPFKLKRLLEMSVNIARGMAWLHARNPPILHRDLHSENILVTPEGVCKVIDFGLSHIQGGYYQINRIYARIRPPEVVGLPDKYSKASDVYMFGLILYELVKGHKGNNLNTTSDHFEALKEEAQPGCHSEDPNLSLEDQHRLVYLTHAYIDLVQLCVCEDPDQRLNFEQLIDRFNEIYGSLPAPKEPESILAKTRPLDRDQGYIDIRERVSGYDPTIGDDSHFFSRKSSIIISPTCVSEYLDGGAPTIADRMEGAIGHKDDNSQMDIVPSDKKASYDELQNFSEIIAVDNIADNIVDNIVDINTSSNLTISVKGVQRRLDTRGYVIESEVMDRRERLPLLIDLDEPLRLENSNSNYVPIEDEFKDEVPRPYVHIAKHHGKGFMRNDIPEDK